MEPIKYSVKLFDVTSLAADGSQIPRRSCEAYLQSPDYQVIIRDKVAIGGVTHKDRKLSPEYKGVVGMDDQVLINDNATHYITKLYFKDGDNFFYADSETFDPDLFAGKRKDNIQNLIGMIKSGVRMPISVVIQALWSKRGTAEKIIRIKGFDHTLNPSFKGAGDIQLYSEVAEFQDEVPQEELKAFSDSIESGELTLQTRIYSSTGEVTILNDESAVQEITAESVFKTFSKNYITYDDVINKYGRGSEECRLFSQFDGKIITEEEIKSLDLQNKRGRNQENHLINQSNSETVGKDLNVNTLEKLEEDDATYSNPAIITGRLLDLDQPRFTQIERILNNYKNYWNKKDLSDDKKLNIKMMLIRDLQILIKSVSKEIYNNRTIDTLFAMGRYGDQVKKSAVELSKTYRKVMISEKVMKFIPKGVQGEYIMDSKNFYNEVMIHCFGEGLDDVQFNLVDIRG